MRRVDRSCATAGAPISYLIEERNMAIEKNSVLGSPSVASRDNNKTASHAGRCPLCGKRVDLDGSLPRCPTHGTSPFEAGAHIRRRDEHRGDD